MNDSEIRKRLKEFCDEIFFGVHSIAEARELEKRLDAFCEANNVTFEQREILAESGAGEELYMMTSAPSEEEWLAMQKK